MFESEPTRRSVVTATGTVALGGLTALAGCSGGGGDGEGGGSGGSDGGDGDGGDSTDAGGSGGAASFDGWLEGVDNYDGVADETGSSEVSVAVGAEGGAGNFAFDPAAIRVSTETTVVWEWTGEGSQHNVAAVDGDFESQLAQEEGFTFEHTFEESGTYRYVCTPHQGLGMKGVVVVE